MVSMQGRARNISDVCIKRISLGGWPGHNVSKYFHPWISISSRWWPIGLYMQGHWRTVYTHQNLTVIGAISNELRTFCNRSWDWSSGTASVLSLACRGFETGCNGFLLSRLLWSQRFLRSSFIIAIETTFTIIYCIGDYYYCINNSESYPTSIY